MNEELVFILNQINTSKFKGTGCFKSLVKPGGVHCRGISCRNCVANTCSTSDKYIRKILTLPLNFK